MKRIVVAVCAVLGLCAIPFLVANPLQAAPPPQNTFVTNDVAHAVPVALTAPVTLTGPVAVAGAVFTAPANNPTPVSRIGILSVSAGGREDRQTIYTVPAGKRLMIESETGLLTASGGVKAQVSVSAFNNSGGAVFYTLIPQVDRGFWDGQGEEFEGSIAVPMFADDGPRVQGHGWRNTDAPVGGGVRAEIGFSGYLVDLPVP